MVYGMPICLYICLMTARDLSALVAQLRQAGGDVTSVEAKSAAGGLPESLASTLSALANLPGGGTIILGLDEGTGFQPVRLTNPQALKQGLAAKARGYVPPVRLEIEDGTVDGARIVVAQVGECDRSAKPCRVASSGKAYIRGYDGDFVLSDLEEQAFLAARKPPMFDRSPVDGATTSDLDEALLASFVDSVRKNDPSGRGRFSDRDELLRRSGVLHSDGRPTVAGVLAMGVYPQQWFPRFVIQAAAAPLAEGPAEARARNQETIDGPIPHMLDRAMDWARRTFGTAIVNMPDGSVHDRYAYPLVAFRELIANALIHRDLDDWSSGLATEVRLRRDRLVITNPGGLYGITVDRLGRDAVTSARNARLVAICQHVHSAETGARAVEALASGIPIVTSALAEVGLPPAHFIDSGISFTVILNQPVAPLTSRARVIYEALSKRSVTIADLETSTGLPGYTIRRTLRDLKAQGFIEQHGGKGRVTTYRRTKKR